MRCHSWHWCRSIFASWCLLGCLRRMMRLQDPLAWKKLKNRLTTRCLAQFDIPAWLSLSLQVSDSVSLCKSRGPMRHDKLISRDDQIHVGCLGTPKCYRVFPEWFDMRSRVRKLLQVSTGICRLLMQHNAWQVIPQLHVKGLLAPVKPSGY